jgi:hypothetical protein
LRNLVFGPPKIPRNAEDAASETKTQGGASISPAMMTPIAAVNATEIVEEGASQMFLNRFFIGF